MGLTCGSPPASAQLERRHAASWSGGTCGGALQGLKENELAGAMSDFAATDFPLPIGLGFNKIN